MKLKGKRGLTREAILTLILVLIIAAIVIYFILTQLRGM